MQNQQTKHQIGQYIVQSQLGKGSFGTVFKVTKKNSNQTQQNPTFYAIKTQTINSVKPMLHLEYQLFEKLKSNRNHLIGHSFPQVYQFKQDDYISYLVMELLDTTLQDFANNQMKNIFSKDSLIRIFYNILQIIERIHKLGYLHRDIKPANFMLKKNQNKSKSQEQAIQTSKKYQPVIYPIDLGLCKKYINPLTNQHISCKENKKMVGTAIFCSINTHKGLQQSRRDDIQSVIYMVTYLVKKLPWQKVCIKTNDAKRQLIQLQSPTKKYQNQKTRLQMYQKIYEIKRQVDFQQFFNDSPLPKSFLVIFKYVKKLSFQEQPQYDYIYKLLEKQHFQLTNKPLSKQNSLCQWDKLQKKLKFEQNKTVQQQKVSKKIKINFKIPEHKLKKNKDVGKTDDCIKLNEEQNGLK